MATIDLNRASVFVRVIERGSFTAAARALGVPVSSASRAVANLEDELGVRLLHRTTRRLSLTDAGQQFFQRMQPLVSEAEAAARALSGEASEPRGVVRITAPPGFGQLELPSILARIVQEHPALTLELQLTNRRVDLIQEGVDLAIRLGRLADSALVARRVADSRMGVFGAPAYLETHGRPRTLSDLQRHACISYGRSTPERLTWRLRGPNGNESVGVSGPLVCDDMAFLMQCAVAGVGLAMVPLELAQTVGERLVRVLPRYESLPAGMYLVWPSQRLVPARVVAVRELLLRELASIG